MKSLDRTGLVVSVAIFLLNTLDGLITAMALASGHFTEVNPLMSRMIDNIGLWFLLPKILIGAVLAIFLGAFWRVFRVARIGGTIVLVIYIIVAINHGILLLLWKGGFLS